jgi:hypothetical protein
LCHALLVLLFCMELVSIDVIPCHVVIWVDGSDASLLRVSDD